MCFQFQKYVVTTRTVIFPPGGQKVLPVFLSTSASTVRWKFRGVVAEEKLIRLLNMVSMENLEQYIKAVEVFAVPGAPTISADL